MNGRAASALAQPTVKDLEPPAPQAELEGLIGQLDATLDAAGYFHPPERTQVTRHMIRTIMSKPRLVEPRGQGGARHDPRARPTAPARSANCRPNDGPSEQAARDSILSLDLIGRIYAIVACRQR